MGFETVSPDDFDKPLTGVGLNIVVRDVHYHEKFFA